MAEKSTKVPLSANIYEGEAFLCHCMCYSLLSYANEI